MFFINMNYKTRYDLEDWLSLHNLDADKVGQILLRICADFPDEETKEYAVTSMTAQQVWETTAQAYCKQFDDIKTEIQTVMDKCECAFDAPADEQPFTLNRGRDAMPFVSLCYRNSAADALCIAHEFGHALQTYLTGEKFIPPIHREVAAFLGEEIFLEYMSRHDPQTAVCLQDAWKQDNNFYLLQDVANLRRCLGDPTTKYDYRWNYPIARFCSNTIMKIFSKKQLLKSISGKFNIETFARETGVSI